LHNAVKNYKFLSDKEPNTTRNSTWTSTYYPMHIPRWTRKKERRDLSDRSNRRAWTNWSK